MLGGGGGGCCLGRTQRYVQTLPSPMAIFDSSGSGCTDAGSWLHPPRPAHSSPRPWWIAPHTMTDGPRLPSLGLDAGINQPLPLPTAHPDPTVTVVSYRENRGDSSLKQDTVSPLSEVPHSVPPPTFTAASPVLQSEPRTSGWTPRPISGGQRPSPNGSN